MKLITAYILICFLFFSCVNRKDNKSLVEVDTSNEIKATLTNGLKIEFLNEILRDTNNRYIYAYDYFKPYIRFTNYEFNPSVKDIALQDSLGRTTNFLGFLSFWLKEKDTIFLNSQIENNKGFSLNPLKAQDYNILDWKTIYNDTLKTNDGYLISKDSLEILTNEIIAKGQFEISNLIFNKSLDLAYVEIHYYGSHRNEILYHKLEDKWLVKERIGNTVY